MGALGLVLNAMVLWNTRYLGGALDVLRARDSDLHAEDEARLSPLLHEHVNLLGRYSFVLSDVLASGDLRPFRDPDAPETPDL